MGEIRLDTLFLTGAALCALWAGVWDIWKRRIPNHLTYTAMILGLVTRVALGGWRGLLDGLGAGLIFGGVFFLLFLVRGMGAGDVKLITAVACWSGIGQGLQIVLLSAILGGVLALIYMLVHKRVRRTFSNVGTLLRYHSILGLHPHPDINLQNPEAIKVPYGVAIAAGTLYIFVVNLMREGFHG